MTFKNSKPSAVARSRCSRPCSYRSSTIATSSWRWNKGTAFGGSIASIGLFGGWAVATLAFMDHGIDNTEIVVFRNEMTFERPARGHLDVRATLDPGEFDACLAQLRAGSGERLRFDVNVDISHDGARCATMKGLYVVWLK